MMKEWDSVYIRCGGDTVSLQNIDVEIRRISLAELSKVLPYFPEITGLFSAEAHYVQTEKDLQLSVESSIDELTYERQRIGDVTLGATWLPGEQGKQYLNAYLNHDNVEVMVADGKLVPTRTGKDSSGSKCYSGTFPASCSERIHSRSDGYISR